MILTAIRCAWAFLATWWATRSLRKAAAAGEEAKVAQAYAERDNAALRAENDVLTTKLKERQDEPAPTSYDGDADRLARVVRDHHEHAD